MNRIVEQFDAMADDGSRVRITCFEDYREERVMGGRVVHLTGLKWYELPGGQKLNYRDNGTRFETVMGESFVRVAA